MEFDKVKIGFILYRWQEQQMSYLFFRLSKNSILLYSILKEIMESINILVKTFLTAKIFNIDPIKSLALNELYNLWVESKSKLQ